MAVRWIAVPGAIVQIVLATALGDALSMAWGWSLGGALVFGLSLSVASTVVLLRTLEDRNAIDSPNGRIAVGWLIVEDLAMVVALVLLPAIAGLLGGSADPNSHGAGGSLLVTLGLTLLKVAGFVALAIILGPRLAPWLLKQVARTGSRELFTLAVLALALGIAYGSAELFGVSFALGAFFAGVVLKESDFSHRAATESLPMQDAFAILFFVSVGMLLDPAIILREPLAVVAVVLVILLGKSVIAFLVVVLLGYPVATALTVSASLAQIGEFSFILAGLGKSLGLLPAEGLNLIVAGALLSIALNPVCFAAIDLLLRRAGGSPPSASNASRVCRPNWTPCESAARRAPRSAACGSRTLSSSSRSSHSWIMPRARSCCSCFIRARPRRGSASSARATGPTRLISSRREWSRSRCRGGKCDSGPAISSARWRSSAANGGSPT
jgi:monovalent cation:H+ antiporter-2, CPA2 family